MLMTVDDIIAKAAALPLRDAAYLIWRENTTFDRLELREWPLRDMRTPEARERSMRESAAQLKYEHDFAQDGPAFNRLKLAHPQADDAQAKQAIIAAVKFDDDCYRYFSHGRAEDYWDMVVRAVARAAKDNPPYLETTYSDARHWIAYNMK